MYFKKSANTHKIHTFLLLIKKQATYFYFLFSMWNT